MANPNIAGVTTILGKTDVSTVGTAATTITTNAEASGKAIKVNTLVVSNTNPSLDIDATVEIYRVSATAAFSIARTVAIPSDSSLIMIGRDNPIWLNEGDSIRVAASTTFANAICSYEELS